MEEKQEEALKTSVTAALQQHVADRVTELKAQRDDLLAVLKGLCTPPDGSKQMLGTHDHGQHFSAACEAWDQARAAIAKAEEQA